MQWHWYPLRRIRGVYTNIKRIDSIRLYNTELNVRVDRFFFKVLIQRCLLLSERELKTRSVNAEVLNEASYKMQDSARVFYILKPYLH